MNTRRLNSSGGPTNGVNNSYTLTCDFGSTPLDHTNFFMVGQFVRPQNVLTITAYSPDGTTPVANSVFAFEWLKASTGSYDFFEPLTWDQSTGVLKKGSTTGSNSGYGFFRIPEGTVIGKIVFEVEDNSGILADELNWGIGCFGCYH